MTILSKSFPALEPSHFLSVKFPNCGVKRFDICCSESVLALVLVDMNDQFYSQNIFCSPKPGLG